MAFDVAVALAFDVNPPLSAPSIAGHGGIGPAGGEAGAEAFSSRQGWRVEKPRHGREAQGIGSRFCFMRTDAAMGRIPFGDFSLGVSRKSYPRDSAEWFDVSRSVREASGTEYIGMCAQIAFPMLPRGYCQADNHFLRTG